MLLAVRISSYGCTRKVWRAIKKLELLLAIASGNSYASFVLSKLPVCNHNSICYMEESALLGTKPLVDPIRHFIRDPSGVFSVCHLCECRIVQWRHDSRLLLLFNWFLASRLFILNIIKRTSHSVSKIWTVCSRGKNNILFLPLEHKIHIFSPPCNILYIRCTQTKHEPFLYQRIF